MKVALSTRVLPLFLANLSLCKTFSNTTGIPFKQHLNGIYYWLICKKRKTNNKDAEDVL